MAAARNVSAAQSRTRVAVAFEMSGKFADGGGLPRPVHANQHDDGGRGFDIGQRTIVGLEHFEQIFADEAAEFAGIADQFAVYALPDSLQDFVGGGYSDIGADEGVFEFFEKIGVDGFAAGD